MKQLKKTTAAEETDNTIRRNKPKNIGCAIETQKIPELDTIKQSN